MQAYIITTLIGCFGLNEKNKIITFIAFPKNPEKIAKKLKLSQVEIIDEEKQLQKQLWKKGYKQFIFAVRKSGVKHAEPNNKAERFVRENLRKLAIEKKFVKNQAEFNQLLTKINLEMTKVKIKKAVGRDKLIVQVNRAIEELDKSINILMERLREWYGLHFPEMNRIISDHEKYANIIEKYGLRQNVIELDLSKFRERSMGMDLTKNDIEAIQSFANKIISFYRLRENLSKYLDELLKEVSPNLRELAGSSLAAKLISSAGSVEKLARMPSSTIQLIGAEKALFRSLHGKGKTPKFGLVFMHPLIQNAPVKHKGKIARVLASKLTMAIRMDYYSKEYKADKLKKELEERVKEILSSK